MSSPGAQAVGSERNDGMAAGVDALEQESRWLDGENEFAVRVVQLTLESDCIVSMLLASPSGHSLPAWTPGAHVDLHLGNSLVRQYSLCGDPNDLTSYRLAVLREDRGRGGSSFVHDRLRIGQELRITGPRNNFGIEPAAAYVFIAGGIGITPILPMIRWAEAASVPWRLLYTGSARSRMAFLAEVDRWAENVHLHPADEGVRLDLSKVVMELDADEHLYACGPAPMLEDLEGLCAQWCPGRLHIERFMPKRREDTSATDGTLEVECRASNVSLTVPGSCSILEAMEEAGIDWPSSCREGICGTCEVAVLEGTPDHRDSLLSPDEQESGETLMVCVSRAKTERLVIDA